MTNGQESRFRLNPVVRVAASFSAAMFFWMDAGHPLYGQKAELGLLPLRVLDQPTDSYVPIITSRQMTIAYHVDAVAPKDLVRIELWYARGRQGAWQLYAYDEDRSSPIAFTAEGEGIYRFLIVAIDRWSRCSLPIDEMASARNAPAIPSAQTLPHQVVFIDYTAPKLYLYSPREDHQDYHSRQMKGRWQGYDAFLPANPVRLDYRHRDSEHWIPITLPRSSGGEFLWRLPQQLEGPIMVRASLTDHAGNRDTRFSGWINLNPNYDPSLSSLEIPVPAGGLSDPFRMERSLSKTPNTMALDDAYSMERNVDEKVGRSFRRGILYGQRREWPQAIQAYEEVLKYGPHRHEARVNLANSLFLNGDYEKALEHYELVLLDEPERETALFGLAQTQITLKKYDKALATLDTLVELGPRDGQAWRMRGEAAEKLGDLEVARLSWQQAARSNLVSVRRLAERRFQELGSYQP